MTSTNKQLRRRIERLEMALRGLYEATDPERPIHDLYAHMRHIDGSRFVAKKVLDEGIDNV